MDKINFVAPCHFGLEKTLTFEIKKIGGENVQADNGRVFFSGDASVCAKANVFLSVAERVCVVLGRFRAVTFDDIFEGIKKMPLSEFIGKHDQFPNNGHSLNSKLASVPAVQKIVKKAMAVNLGKAYGMNTMPEDGKTVCKIRFSLMKDEFILMLDTSGDGLHKRGYREIGNAAPIRETLAAGIVDIARVRQDLIIDPFCGSGTLLIESALKALNIAPGLNRKFAGEHMKFLPKSVWKAAREEARSLIKTDSDFRAMGFDNDPECVKLTLENAKKAGVEKFITAEKRDIKDLELPQNETAKIITNPPYGERLLEVSEAREIYKTMGERLLPLLRSGENSLYVITPDEEFEALFGLKASKNRKLYNGMLMCRLYIYFNYEKS